MIMHVTNPEAAAEVEATAALLTRATVAYIARLKDIADIGTLAAGSHGFDYAAIAAGNRATETVSRAFGVKLPSKAPSQRGC